MMVLQARRQHHNPYGSQFPDDDGTKVVICEADGLRDSLEAGALNPDDRHVLIRWTNGRDSNGDTYYVQIIQLSGGPRNYAFHTPSVRPLTRSQQRVKNTEYVLGEYTRAERDQIVALAKNKVEFEKTSVVNNCQTWMRDLLEAMVEARLLDHVIFTKIDADVPLKHRVPELRDDAENVQAL